MLKYITQYCSKQNSFRMKKNTFLSVGHLSLNVFLIIDNKFGHTECFWDNLKVFLERLMNSIATNPVSDLL